MKVNLSITGTNSSFNLNLLECKLKQAASELGIPYSFNLNLLECKSISLTFSTTSALVLISTYWNVNYIDDTGYTDGT